MGRECWRGVRKRKKRHSKVERGGEGGRWSQWGAAKGAAGHPKPCGAFHKPSRGTGRFSGRRGAVRRGGIALWRGERGALRRRGSRQGEAAGLLALLPSRLFAAPRWHPRDSAALWSQSSPFSPYGRDFQLNSSQDVGFFSTFNTRCSNSAD